MIRIWDSKDERWLGGNTYLTPNMDVVRSVQAHRRRDDIVKLKLSPSSSFIFHIDIGLYDKNGILIFEGDIVKSEFDVVGIVTYAPQFSSYVLLDYKEMKYYTLGFKVCNASEVIGNVIENKNLLPNDYGDHEVPNEHIVKGGLKN